MRKRLGTIAFLVMLLAMLAAGRLVYKDYSMTVDEHVDRTTTILNYQRVMKTLLGREVSAPVSEETGDLSEWRDRYYGVALQLPTAVLEDLTGFTMPMHDVYAIRHLYTFLLCMAGWVCFYLFLRRVFHSPWPALAGFAMVTLYPRFWGEQFTNIKDMVFAASCCACLYGTALCLEHEGKWRYEVLAAFLGALCANTRFIGIQFPVLLLGYRALRDWCLTGISKGKRARWFVTFLPRYLAHAAMVLAFYIAITPAAWDAPLAFMRGVFDTFSNYAVWEGRVAFLGKAYAGNALPWYYLWVWVLFSVPLWVLALTLGGLAALVGSIRRKDGLRQALLSEYRYLILCAVVALIPLMTPLFREVTLYDSWRHAYYVFPCLVTVALFGLRAAYGLLKGRRWGRALVTGALCLLLCGQGVWTALNHPYEKVYFNPIGRPYADGMDRDHWFESTYHQLQVILKNDPTPRISVDAEVFVDRMVHHFLPYEQQIRFYCWYDRQAEVDYVIDTADMIPPPESGFTPVYELRMRDGLLLSTLYVRNEVLQERFGGVYPAQEP